MDSSFLCFSGDSCSQGSSEESCDPLVLCPSAPRSSSSSQHSCPGSNSPINCKQSLYLHSPSCTNHKHCRHKCLSTAAWILTPPPCFTAEGEASISVEMSPMENLLIEHPSMSVYGPTLRSRRGGSTADESNSSESSNDAETRRATRAGIACHQPPRRPPAVAVKAGLVENVQNIRSSQRLQHGYNTRQLSRNSISHSNKVNEYRSLGKHQRKHNRALRPSGCKNGRLAQRQY